MNKRRRAFVKGVLKGKTYKDAALDANFQDEKYGSYLMRQDDVREYLLYELQQKGVDGNLAARKMREGMDAMTPPKKDGGERYEDYFVRKQYLDIYFKLTGAYAPEKTEHVEKQIVLNFTPDMIQGLVDSGAISQDEATGAIIEAQAVEDDEEEESYALPGEEFSPREEEREEKRTGQETREPITEANEEPVRSREGDGNQAGCSD